MTTLLVGFTFGAGARVERIFGVVKGRRRFHAVILLTG